MARVVWGIDVSKTSVKAVRLEGTETSCTLTRETVIPYDRGEGEGHNLDDQIRSALEELKEQQKLGSEPVVFSLPSHSTFNRLIKLPPVDDAKIPEIVRYEAQTQIPFNIDEVIWDYQYIDRRYAPGEEREVVLFAVKKDTVDQFLGNVAGLAFNVDAVQFAPVALFNFLLRDQDVPGACVALDMGGENTDLIVIDGTKFWVRNLPITGNDITKALQKAFNIPFSEAEKLKLKAGQSQQAQKIFNAIQPVLRDLVNEINRSIGYYKSISKTSKFDRIMLLGNATKTLNFQKFISQSLQLPAARVQNLNKIQVDPKVDQGALSSGLASIGTALGLALQGLGQTVNKVNLLPPAYLKKKELTRKKPFIVGTAAALYVLVLLIWFANRSEAERLRETVRGADGEKKQLNQLNARFDEVRQIDKVKEALEAAASISSERDLILKVMDEINPNIPNNGLPEMNDDARLWVVDWRFEELPKPAPGDASAQPGAAPTHAPPAAGALRPLPLQKYMKAVLEVCIKTRANDPDGRKFIMNTLLNWDGSRPAAAARPSVIKRWALAESTGWKVEVDVKNLGVPRPRDLAAKPEEADPNTEKPYSRWLVTLELPMGDPPPPAAAAAAPAGTAEKK